MPDDQPLIVRLLEHYGADLSRVRETGWRPVKCPYHSDKTASASVHIDKGAFVCHACGVKGDAIKLIELREGLDFIGACEWAQSVLGAGDLGVSKPARHADKPKRRSQWRDRLSL